MKRYEPRSKDLRIVETPIAAADAGHRNLLSGLGHLHRRLDTLSTAHPGEYSSLNPKGFRCGVNAHPPILAASQNLGPGPLSTTPALVVREPYVLAAVLALAAGGACGGGAWPLGAMARRSTVLE